MHRNLLRSGGVGLAVLCIAVAAPATAAAAWPIWPTNQQHPIRGGFGDERWNGRGHRWDLHGGVDVAVDERIQASRKVYSLVTGKVRSVTANASHACGSIVIGRVMLGHVSAPRVKVGQKVVKGQEIARNCPGAWHVHVSEFDADGFDVNPLRKGGVLYPYEDTAPPVVGSVAADSGGYQVRIEDPDSFLGWFAQVPRLYDDHLPNLVKVDGRLVIDLRRVGKGSGVLHSDVHGDLSTRDLTADACMHGTGSCQGQHWLRLGPLAPGDHLMRVWDVAGNLTTVTLTID